MRKPNFSAPYRSAIVSQLLLTSTIFCFTFVWAEITISLCAGAFMPCILTITPIDEDGINFTGNRVTE